nr:FAD-containing oxidoreductase [Pyrinomonadaceae bacterium]
MSKKFDAIIIGAGQAGPFLAGKFTDAGKSVAFIERKLFGGTCVNTGCTPTKAMVASAYAAHLARRASDYGVEISGDVSVNMRRVKERKDRIVADSRNGLENWIKGMTNCTVFEGQARFTAPKTIAIGDESLTAENIFINVGGRAAVPNLEGIDQIEYFTNSTLLDIDFLPEHLIIVGGSYIGLEFGQMFRRFGSKVTIIEMGERLISREDEDISDAIKNILKKEDIEIRLNSKCISFSKNGDKIIAHVDCASGEPQISGSHVLLATGRVPNTDDLGLKSAGIKCDERGYIIVDDELQTNVSGVYAVGDCNGRGAFTHTSWNDAEIVAANLLAGGKRRLSDRILTYGLFIDPPLGRVGMTEREAIKTGRNLLVGKRPMSRVSRAVEKGESEGLMKICVDAETKKILGAAILGVGGDEAVHSILDV